MPSYTAPPGVAPTPPSYAVPVLAPAPPPYATPPVATTPSPSYAVRSPAISAPPYATQTLPTYVFGPHPLFASAQQTKAHQHSVCKHSLACSSCTLPSAIALFSVTVSVAAARCDNIHHRFPSHTHLLYCLSEPTAFGSRLVENSVQLNLDMTAPMASLQMVFSETSDEGCPGVHIYHTISTYICNYLHKGFVA